MVSNAVFLSTVITVVVALVGLMLGVVYFLFSRLDARLAEIEKTIAGLREDVAALKATRP
jgi:uncharacterized protein YoxC